MKNIRFQITRFGDAGSMQMIEEDIPQPGAGEARIKVQAAGVSYADLLVREGLHPETWFKRLPFTPGWEVVGEVDAVGQGVTDWKEGQIVAALPVFGGYATYLCLPVRELVAVPEGLDADEAACLTFNYVTAYQMLTRSVKLEPGHLVLIHSAAGGIGSALVELGQQLSLKMFGTASPAKHPYLEQHGCVPIDYHTADFVSFIARETGGGVDAVFDGIGGDHLLRSLKAVKQRGKVVGYGLTAARSGKNQNWQPRNVLIARAFLEWLRAFSLNLLPGGKRVVLYSVQRLKWRHPNWYRQDLTHLFDLLKAKKLNPHIFARMPLSQAAQAQELLDSGKVIGKIILKP